MLDMFTGIIAKMPPQKLLKILQPAIVGMREPLLDAIKKHEVEHKAEVHYMLYAEKDTKEQYTGRVMVSFVKSSEEGLVHFNTQPFEDLLISLISHISHAAPAVKEIEGVVEEK